MPRGHKKRVSSNWYKVTYHGTVMEGCRFIAFKTPIPSKGVKADQLIKDIESTNKALGLVIDLTSTKKFYQPEIFTRYNIEYYKINCDGQSVPKELQVTEFKTCVADYLKCHAHDMTVIGIHCTHGINRSGYLICRYLMDNLGYTPDKAMQEFAKCRGYRIDKKILVDDLLSREVKEIKQNKRKCCVQ